MILGVLILPLQVRITTVFTLPISASSDWNLPWPQLKALFVFPTYFPVQFSRCGFGCPKPFGSVAATRLRDPLRGCPRALVRPSAFPHKLPWLRMKYPNLSIPILQNDTVFHQCQKHQICRLFRALNSFRCLFAVSVPLFSYI